MYWDLKKEWAHLDFVGRYKYVYNYEGVFVLSRYEYVQDILFKYKAAKVIYLQT